MNNQESRPGGTWKKIERTKRMKQARIYLLDQRAKEVKVKQEKVPEVKEEGRSGNLERKTRAK